MIEIPVTWRAPHYCNCPYAYHREHLPDVMEWIEQYDPWPWGIRRAMTEPYGEMGFVFIFDDASMALLFKLTWGGA